MRRLLIKAIVTAAPVLLSANATASEGQITEKGSGRPVADAFVIAEWSGQAPNPVDAATICLHAEITRSDEHGRFKISRTSGNLDPLIARRHRSVGVYKPGYQLTRESRSADLYFVLEPATGAKDKRFAQVADERAPFGCGLADKDLLPFLKARAVELTALASTPQELEQLASSLFSVERIEFGEVEALKRSAERRKQRETARQEVK